MPNDSPFGKRRLQRVTRRVCELFVSDSVGEHDKTDTSWEGGLPRQDSTLNRGGRHRERIANVSERVARLLESMGADEILSRSAQVENIDAAAPRTLVWIAQCSVSGVVNLRVLSGGRAVVQVNQKNE